MREEAMKAPLPTLAAPELAMRADKNPEYPEDWLELTEEYQQDYLLPTHAANERSRTSYSLFGKEKQAISAAHNNIQQMAFVVNSVSMELHEHANTVHGLKELLLAQICDVHVLAVKKLVLQQSINHNIFPENVQVFAKNYYKQEKKLLLVNAKGILCVKYPKSQRALHERPCMIAMAQLFCHEIFFKAHDAIGYQGIAKVPARILEPGLVYARA